MSSSNHTHYAYGREMADVEAVMRLHAVKRWHMIDTTRIQTLAEHTANVATLAYVIAATAPDMWFGAPETVATMALIHDIDEVFTGDIPTHTKARITGLSDLQKEVTPHVFNRKKPAPAAQLVKICDLVDGIRFIRIHGVDTTAVHAKLGLEGQLHSLMMSVASQWPDPVVKLVRSKAMFYAYELS